MNIRHNHTLVMALTMLFWLVGSQLYAQAKSSENLVIHADSSRQTVAGFGASLAYYEGWLNAHPKREEVYEAVFGELSLDILRVRTAYDYDPDMVGRVREYVEASELVRGTPIPVLATSWGPPGYLKNTGDRSNGGTLRYTIDQGEVKFDYAGFAHWWKNAMLEYHANGIYPDYITIQNEPGWAATWETCLMSPAELVNETDTLAGYNRALDAVYDTLQGMEHLPKILGPEFENIFGNTLENYVNALDVNKLDGISHHLYYGVDPEDPYSSTNFTKAGNIHPEIPHFQTEYSSETSDWFSLAGLLYKSFHDEEVVAYLYWDLIWGENGGLITLEFPWDPSRWTDPDKGYIVSKDFYAFKQFSAFVHPGWKRLNLELTGKDGVALAFRSPSGDSATCVVINRSVTDSLSVRLGIPGYRIQESSVYTTSETENCVYMGELTDSLLTLAPRSIATANMRISSYNPAEDTLAPTIPENLQVTEQTPESLSISWDPSTDSIGVSGYRIFVDGVLAGTSLLPGYTISQLTPATSYQLTVSAFDDAENESQPSEPLTATTLEAPDTTPPVVEVSDTIYSGEMGFIEVTSTENGMVYLVPSETGGELSLIRGASLDSAEVAGYQSIQMGIEGLENGTYWVYARDTAMNLSTPASVIILGVGLDNHLIGTFSCFPNPFSKSTTIRFALRDDQSLTLTVYNSHGGQVRKVTLGQYPAGDHQVTFRREGIAGGVYLFRLENDKGEGRSGRWIIQD